MARKKVSRDSIISALKDAIEHVRINGREGRTIPDIAAQFGVKPHSLRCKLSAAGLTPVDIQGEKSGDAGAAQSNSSESPVDSVNDSLPNWLSDKEKQTFPIKSAEDRGNERVTSAPIRSPNTGGEIGPKSAENESEAAISAIKKEVLTECKRLLREARRMTEIKSVRDYKTIADLALSMLGDSGKSSGAGKQLIQVNILADSGSRSPRSIAAIEPKAGPINESLNETVTIEAETVTL